MRLSNLHGRRRASVIILTLWIIVVLSLIATSLAFDVQVNAKLTLLQREQFVAYNLARAAVAVGMTHLHNDTLIDDAENRNQRYDAFSDVWAQPDRKEKEIEVELGKGTYELEITDEDSKISLNHAGFKLLKAMLEYYGYEPPDSDDIAYAIIDWRDPDDMAGGQGANGAAAGEKENERYSSMVGQRVRADTVAEDLIYQCPNEPFLTTEQLLDIVGITPELYYGFNPDDQEEKDRRVRDDIAMGKNVRKQRERKKKGLAMKDIVTVNSSGKINVNTASQEVLTIMMYAGANCANLDAAESAAESIVKFRGGEKHGRAPKADDAFRSLADLAKVPGVNQQVIGTLSQAGGLGVTLSFQSDVFCIQGIGRMGRAKKTITALVQRQLEQYDPDDARLVGNKGSSRPRGSFASRGSTKKRGRDEDNKYRLPAIRVVQWIE